MRTCPVQSFHTVWSKTVRDIQFRDSNFKYLQIEVNQKGRSQFVLLIKYKIWARTGMVNVARAAFRRGTLWFHRRTYNLLSPRPVTRSHFYDLNLECYCEPNQYLKFYIYICSQTQLVWQFLQRKSFMFHWGNGDGRITHAGSKSIKWLCLFVT